MREGASRVLPDGVSYRHPRFGTVGNSFRKKGGAPAAAVAIARKRRWPRGTDQKADLR